MAYFTAIVLYRNIRKIFPFFWAAVPCVSSAFTAGFAVIPGAAADNGSKPTLTYTAMLFRSHQSKA